MTDSTFHCFQCGSDDVDTQDAMTDIIGQAQDQLSHVDKGAPKGALVFFDVAHDAEVIRESISQAWPDLPLAGCSSYGEFNLKEGMQDGSIQLILLCGPITIHVRAFEETDADGLDERCAALMDIPESPAVSFLLFDTVQFPDFEAAFHRIKCHAPDDHIIIGGGASDDFDFDSTTLLHHNGSHHTGCVMMHLCGNITASTSTSLGWDSQGDMKTVTKSNGNTLLEIDHKPALDFYLDETGGVSPNIELPLAVFSPEGDFLYNRANAGAVTLPDGHQGVQLFGHVAAGSQVQVSSTDKATLLSAIPNDLTITQNHFPEDKPIALALFFSCVSRRAFLSTDVAKEATAIMSVLPEHIPGMGFYTYGEIGKMSMNSPVLHHNNSLVYVLLG